MAIYNLNKQRDRNRYAEGKQQKLAQRQTYANGHNISVGLTGDVSPKVMQKALESSFICKATFWGFDDKNNNIVEIKSVYA